MIRCGRLTLWLAAMCLGVCARLEGVSAQAIPADSENKFYKRAKNYASRPHDTKEHAPLNQMITGNSIFEVRTRGATIWRDWMARGEEEAGGGDGGAAGSEEETKDVSPAPQTDYLNALAPIQGKLMGLMGQGYKEAIKIGMKGPVAKQFIAFYQTEPGVAAGVTAAEQIVGQNIALTYQAQDHLINTLPENDWAREVALTAYNGCLREKMQSMGWVNAVNECLGDSNEEPGSGHAVQASFKPDPNGWIAEKHPAKNDATAGDIVDPGETKVSVLSELFNQDGKGSGESDKLKDLAESFLEWFGDYELEFEASGENEGKVDSTRVFKHTKKEPQKKLSQEVRTITLNRYKDIAKLMKSLCEHIADIESGEEGSGNVPKLCDATENNFWNKLMEAVPGGGDLKEAVKNLMIPEVPFQSAVLNAILDMWLGKSKTIKKDDCRIWDPEGDAAPDKVTEKTPFVDLITLLYDYAKYVAVDQILRSFLEAEKYVARRSAGPTQMADTLRAAALNLIYSVAQTDDIAAARAANVNELVAFIEEKIFRERAKQVGKQGRALTSIVRDGSAILGSKD